MKRTLLALLSGMILIGLPSILWAQMVDVQVVSSRGSAFSLIPVDGTDRDFPTYRAYVEALKGARYGIRVRNNTPVRVGLVIAVDGRNIISGKKSYLKRDERMYLLEPYASGLYDGWRTGQDQVNRFYFTDAGDSYAGAWDDFSAMGVVALAVFPEKRPPDRWHGDEPWGTLDSYKGKGAPPSKSYQSEKSFKSEPGTGFGEEKYSPSVRVEFVPEERVAEKHFLKYEWRETLCKKGVIDCRPPRNRFWEERDDYAPYPPRRDRRYD